MAKATGQVPNGKIEVPASWPNTVLSSACQEFMDTGLPTHQPLSVLLPGRLSPPRALPPTPSGLSVALWTTTGPGPHLATGEGSLAPLLTGGADIDTAAEAFLLALHTDHLDRPEAAPPAKPPASSRGQPPPPPPPRSWKPMRYLTHQLVRLLKRVCCFDSHYNARLSRAIIARSPAAGSSHEFQATGAFHPALHP